MQSYISEIPTEFITKTLLFVMQITLCAIIFLFIEKLRPIQNINYSSKEKRSEFYLMMFNGIIIQPLLYFLLLMTFTATIKDLIPYQIFDAEIQSLPFIIQIFLALLLIDLKVYSRHRFTHNFMWRVHAVHHSAEDINWLTGWRLHPAEILADILITIPLLHILGFGGSGIATASFIFFVFNFFTHLNINLEYKGLLRYLVGSPNFHRWHHAKFEKDAFNKNFSVIFPFIDWIFGSFYHPQGQLPKEYGIYQRPNEIQVNQSLWGYLSYPFMNKVK